MRAKRTTNLLHAIQFVQGPLILHVSGIDGGSRLKQNDPCLFVSNRAMFDATRDHQEFALFQPDVSVAKLHAKAPFDHQEQLVFVFMMMPDELSFQLVELYQLAIQFAGNIRLPILRNLCKLLIEIDLFHILSWFEIAVRVHRTPSYKIRTWN